MPGVFLSYASPDSPLVTRVFADLLRARVGTVWCYEVSSEYGVDFRDEYLERVKTSDWFVLFDSSHARNSPAVREEVAMCRNYAGTVRMLVCLSEPVGSWRQSEIFSGQNRLVHIDFGDYGFGIRELCSCFEASYVPRFTMPRDVDFENEVRAAADLFELQQRQAVLDKYAYFRSVYGGKPQIAEAQLLVLISEHLETIDRPIVSPLLALGALRIEARRFDAAAEAFARVAERAPDDPRGWAGHGLALFGQRRFGEAAAALERSLDCIVRADDGIHRRFEAEVRHNAASALFEAGDVAGAWRRLEPSVASGEPQTEDLILGGKIQLTLADMPRARTLLMAAATRIAAAHPVEPDLVIDLVEGLRRIGAGATVGRVLATAVETFPFDTGIVRQWAVFQAGLGDHQAAISAYDRALRLEPNSLRCLAELALLKKTAGQPNSWRPLVQRCLEAHPTNPVDEYFVGLAHFLEGREETARYYHTRSRRSKTCVSWPYYRALTD